MVGDGASVGNGWELESTPWFDAVFSYVIDFSFLSDHKKYLILPGFLESFCI